MLRTNTCRNLYGREMGTHTSQQVLGSVDEETLDSFDAEEIYITMQNFTTLE